MNRKNLKPYIQKVDWVFGDVEIMGAFLCKLYAPMHFQSFLQ